MDAEIDTGGIDDIRDERIRETDNRELYELIIDNGYLIMDN